MWSPVALADTPLRDMSNNIPPDRNSVLSGVGTVLARRHLLSSRAVTTSQGIL